MLPEINKTYNYFDDGKIIENRRDEVKICKIIPFNKIDKKILKNWKEEVELCHWLYRKNTDYFIKGRLKKAEQDVIFVRTKHNGWFSLGWWAGSLDIDNSLTKRLNQDYLMGHKDLVMTLQEFNKKYSDYIEDGHYGLAINIPEVIDFLDKEMPKLIENNMQPFKFSQIKSKFGYARVYCNAQNAIIRHLENDIDKILKIK
jgi:hypothetical protein